MTDDFERTLRRALQPKGPGADFAERAASRLDPSEKQPASVAQLVPRRASALRSWRLPAALAACIIAGVGLLLMRQHARDAARAYEARAQLMQALSIASENVNIVRAAVAREENPDS